MTARKNSVVFDFFVHAWQKLYCVQGLRVISSAVNM